MKVLLSVLHFGLLRNFESLVLELARRGHEVLILADEPDDLGGDALAASLAAECPAVRAGRAPSYEGEPWFRVARKLRQAGDYLRFADDRYVAFPKLRQRAAERTPRGLLGLSRVPGLSGRSGRRLLLAATTAIDRLMPRLPAMDALLAAERPDVALFASVTNPRAPQLDHLRSAQAMGLRTGVCVYSWDHLSSKTLIRSVPDRVFVWNGVQKQEAIDQHGLPADRIVVTGAQVYDQWFGRAPTRTREEFARAAGLPGDTLLLLYVCSALTPDPGEKAYVRRWVEAIRRSRTPSLAAAGVLIRPHPERRAEWRGVDWRDLGPVVVAGDNPISVAAKADYFDALSYSSAVVGLVTSAFLEAAIVGRPVLTITYPDLRAHQEGMLHFRYLLDVEGGLLTVAGDLDEHVAQLEAIVTGESSHAAQQRRFLGAFVRPAGLDRPATPVFADAVEALAALPAHAPAPEPARWRRQAALGLVTIADRGWLEPLMRDRREHAERRSRDANVRQHRREHDDKWRQHRRRKLVARVQWKLKRVRDLVRPAATGRQD